MSVAPRASKCLRFFLGTSIHVPMGPLVGPAGDDAKPFVSGPLGWHPQWHTRTLWSMERTVRRRLIFSPTGVPPHDEKVDSNG